MVLNVLLAELGPHIGILVVMLVSFVFITTITIIRRYRRCPSDKVLVIYGKVGKSVTGEGERFKIIHGGSAFIWPIIQDYEFLDLTPIQIPIELQGALSSENIRINISSKFTVAISTEEKIIQNAAERLLGLSFEAINDIASDIIFGQLRVVIASMSISDIYSKREELLTKIYDGVLGDLI